MIYPVVDHILLILLIVSLDIIIIMALEDFILMEEDTTKVEDLAVEDIAVEDIEVGDIVVGDIVVVAEEEEAVVEVEALTTHMYHSLKISLTHRLCTLPYEMQTDLATRKQKV